MKKTILALAVLLASGTSSAFVLTFEGAGNQASLNNFYNGGTDSQGNSGTNYNIAFGTNALSIIDSDVGTGNTGNIANEPSPSTALFFLTGSAILNYAAGFDTGFSFFYSSNGDATVNVYDGLNATGNVLASLSLASQHSGNNCLGDPNGGFCNWTAVGSKFAGTARSIDFGGTVDQVAYDNVTFGSDVPGTNDVPEPSSLALLGLGLLGSIWARRRKQ